MTSIIIGSTAMRHWFSDFREPRDLDLIEKESEYSHKQNGQIVECHAIPFIEEFDTHVEDGFLTPKGLLTLKMSHACWPIKTTKTLSDIEFLQRKGIRDYDHELLNKLRKHWDVVHGKRPVFLKMKNEEFFTKYVKRKIPHDELHLMLAFGDRPLNERIRPNLESPACSYLMFSELTEDEKFKCAQEEIMVIAVERFGINKSFRRSQTIIAVRSALAKLISQMTTGWFNLYMLENYAELKQSAIEMQKHIFERIE